MSKENISVIVRVLAGLVAAFAAEFLLTRETGILEPSASSIFRLEVLVITFTCAMLLSEEIRILVDRTKPNWKHRMGKLLFLLCSFTSSVVIFGFLVQFLRMKLGPF